MPDKTQEKAEQWANKLNKLAKDHAGEDPDSELQGLRARDANTLAGLMWDLYYAIEFQDGGP